MSGNIIPPKRFIDKPLVERIFEVRTMQKNYPKMLPVIVQPARRSKFTDFEDLQFSIQVDCVMAKFFHIIRSKLQLGQDEALFFTIGDLIPPVSATIGVFYEEYKSKEDDFLYITFNEESVYGA